MNKKVKVALIYIIQLCVMVLVTYLLFTVVLRPIKIVGVSMTPTVQEGDFAFTNVIGLNFGTIERFDIVVINREELGKDIIKRVIGLPNETIEYKNDQLYVDGVFIEETFLNSEFIEQAKASYHVDVFTYDFTYTVPEGEYFVLGDNRLNSTDSRYYGTFRKDDMLGKGGIIIYPFSHFNWIN